MKLGLCSRMLLCWLFGYVYVWVQYSQGDIILEFIYCMVVYLFSCLYCHLRQSNTPVRYYFACHSVLLVCFGEFNYFSVELISTQSKSLVTVTGLPSHLSPFYLHLVMSFIAVSPLIFYLDFIWRIDRTIVIRKWNSLDRNYAPLF